MARVLIVDDEKSVRVTLGAFLEEDDHKICMAESVVEALKLIGVNDFDVILSDVVLPHTNGLELLKHIRQISVDVQVIMITGEPTVETATEAMRSGVFDFLHKPVAREAVKKVVAKAAEVKALKDENRIYREHLEEILKERTTALIESEAKYRSLIENINVGLFRKSTGITGKFIEVNPAIIKMFGCENKADFLATDFADLYQDPNIIRQVNDKMLREGFLKSEEIQLKRKDGTFFTGSLSGVVISDDKGKTKYFDGIIEDITERKKMGNKIHNLATVLQDSQEAVVIQDLDGQIIAWDRGAELMYGWKEEEAIGMNFSEIVPVENRHEFIDFIKQLKEGVTIEPFEAKRISKDGWILYTWLTFTILKDEEGNTYAIATTEQDITRRKQAEKDLSDSEDRYRTMIESLGEGVIVIDSENRFILTNPAADRVFGVVLGKLTGHRFDEFVDEENLNKIREHLELSRKTKTAGYEIEIIREKGWEYQSSRYSWGFS